MSKARGIEPLKAGNVEVMPEKFAVNIDSTRAQRIRARWAEYTSPGKGKRTFVLTAQASRDINDLLEEIVKLERALEEVV